MDLSNIVSDDGRGEKTACDRCAGCCTGGGPILRKADAHLVRSGKIPSSYLYTIRKGELLFDRELMKMVPVKTDIIKIKINKETFECRFLEENSHCTIYNTRPSECRAFKCWDTKQIQAKYDEEPLERFDLLSDIEGLWELVNDHQNRCSYEIIGPLAKSIKDGEEGTALSDLNEIIKYDIALRKTMVAKGGVTSEMLEFLLGRSLIETIVMFDMKIEEKDGSYMLSSVR